MAQVGNECEAPEQAPAYWSFRRLFSDLVNDPDDGNCNQRDEWSRDKGMRDAAVMLESRDRTTECPEHVEIRGFSSERHGKCGVSRFTVEAGAGETGSGKKVGYGFHRLDANVTQRVCESAGKSCVLAQSR